ncbi:MAG: hypothetical protein ACM3N5_08935 [Candidatus Eiseniibacteriota bacterium]
MATARQKRAAKRNVKKAQRAWRGLSSRARARAQPEGNRAKPGSSGRGQFFHIQVRPKSEFASFRTQDVGKSGGIERVAGRRASGSWATQKWLIGKEHAHMARGRLVGDTKDARKVLDALGAAPRHLGGDRFVARPRPNVPERDKPTPAQRRARRRNIKKAQAARRRRA